MWVSIWPDVFKFFGTTSLVEDIDLQDTKAEVEELWDFNSENPDLLTIEFILSINNSQSNYI